jgi:hypothetical protein
MSRPRSNGPAAPVSVVEQAYAELTGAAPPRDPRSDGIYVWHTGADIMARQPLQRRWLVEGLIPRRGVVLLSAPPKHRKTFLAQQLAMSVISGEPFLTRQVPEVGPVVFLEFEDPEGIADRFRIALRAGGYGRAVAERLLMPEPDPELLKAGRAAQLTIGEGPAWQALLDRLTGATAGNDWVPDPAAPKVKMIVLDPLAFAHHATENSNDEMGTQVIQPLQALARRLDALILLVHHATKVITPAGGQRPDPFDLIRGATVIRSGTDANYILLKDTKTEEGYRLYGEVRQSPENFSGGIPLRFEAARPDGSRGPEFVAYDAEDRTIERVVEAIRKVVNETHARAKRSDIERVLDLGDWSAVFRAVDRSIERGEIAHSWAGGRSPHLYWLPGVAFDAGEVVKPATDDLVDIFG